MSMVKETEEVIGTAGIRRSLEHIVGSPFTDGNQVTVLRNGDEIFPAMLEAIRKARECVDFLTFVYWQGKVAREFADTLSEAARRGLRVRVLLDSYGAMPMRQELIKQMKEAGVDVRWFRPLSTWKIWHVDNRTHRKLLICDRRTGFTGGVGIAEEWEGDARNPDEWRETHFRLQGPCVAGLCGAFYQNWSEAGHVINRQDVEEIADDGPRPGAEGDYPAEILTLASSASPGWTDFAMLVQAIIALAEKELRIATPYFAPDEALESALRDAASRGVNVRILISGDHTDQRFQRYAAEEAFERLLHTNIQFAYYQKTMLHEKLTIMDDCLVLAGSGNINQRSMLKDDEFNFVALGPELAGELTRHYEMDWENREDVDPTRWRRRHWWQRAGEKLAALFRHQL